MVHIARTFFSFSHTTSNLHEAEQNDYTIKHHKRSTLLSQNATFSEMLSKIKYK